MTRHGEFNWIELQTRDAQKAIDFYSASIGWAFQAEEMPSGGTYWIGTASGRPVCGILTLDDGNRGTDPDRWMVYVHVDDLDDAIARIGDRGGEVLRAPWDVPGVGRVAMIRDPGGSELGLVTPV